jgi:hypothetical protein
MIRVAYDVLQALRSPPILASLKLYGLISSEARLAGSPENETPGHCKKP